MTPIELATQAATTVGVVKSLGLFVGWLVVTYGIILWGTDSLNRHPIGVPFVFVTAGFAILLVSNRAVLPPGGPSMVAEAMGYLAFAAVATGSFAWLLSIHFGHKAVTPSSESAGESDDRT